MSREETTTMPPPAEAGWHGRVLPRGLRHPLAGQIARFGAVGITNTLLSWVIFYVADKLGVWYPAASAGAFIIGALNGYTLNRRWTFKAGAFSATTFMRYIVVTFVGLAINEGVLIACVRGLSLQHFAAQVIATVAFSIVTFVLNRQWAFACEGDTVPTPSSA